MNRRSLLRLLGLAALAPLAIAPEAPPRRMLYQGSPLRNTGRFDRVFANGEQALRVRERVLPSYRMSEHLVMKVRIPDDFRTIPCSSSGR